MQVDLSLNNLGPEGGKAIASGIRNNTSLTACDVRENGITGDAAQQIRDAVKDRAAFALQL